VLKSHSATSLACAIIGAGILLGLQWSAIRARIDRIEIYAITIATLLLLLNSAFDLYGFIIVDVLGRDLTLTSRTEVWPILLGYMDNPLFGAGFMGFWTGATLSTLYEQYGILQAHNGYLELYLNGGLVALFLFGILIVTSNRNIKRQLFLGDDFGMMRLILLAVGLAHNYAEASISKGGLIWFVLLLALARYPKMQASNADVRVTRPSEDSPTRGTVPGSNAAYHV
jgi:exopolysaccharide production protein ExoQ